MDRVQRGIERWAEVRPELDTTGTAVVARVLRLAALAQDRIAGALAPHGLQPAEYSVLAVLRSHGGAAAELSPGVVADAAHLSSGGVANAASRLVAAGLLTRRPDPADGRGTLLRLTDDGRRTADRAVEDVAAAERALLEGVGSRERRALASGLAGLLERLEPPPRRSRPERSRAGS